MWVIRQHTIQTPYSKSYRKVRRRYLSMVEDGVLPTHAEMELWISKKMTDRCHEATFSIQVTEEMFEASVVENSLESHYNDIKRGEEVTAIGTRTRKRIRCVVCQTSKHSKIKVSCGHIFHRKCIDEWLCWKQECPICKVHIEMKKK